MKTRCLEIACSPGRSYRIYVGSGLLDDLGEQVARLVSGRTACVVTDATVGALYLAQLSASMEQVGFTVHAHTIEPGEQSKSIASANELWEAFAHCGLGRDGVVLALGGGVVGDLAGFAASTYMRGVACVQIPTTLLAMVDSSVGGKTAINLSRGKNLVGTFAQPVLVAADLELLSTLPAAEWENGFAEIAKAALIDGDPFYSWLTEYADDLRKQGKGAVQQAVIRALAFKGRVVSADERESGERECLNYGHTFAHALEAVAGYGAVSHGRAVAAGMRFAAALACEALELSSSFEAAQNALLDSLGLTGFTDSYTADELFERISIDKKVRGGKPRFVFVTAPGQWQTLAVDPDLLKIHLLLWADARL